MEHVLLTLNAKGLRYVEVNGRQFAVAPINILRPQVLTGSKGALFYPQNEIAKTVEAWNGRPMVVRHPERKGNNVSAHAPDIFAKQEIGRIYDSRLNSDGSNSADGWFDVELTKRIDNRIWNALIAGEKIEVSTGLFTDNEDAPLNSTHEGTPYTQVARNYRPDHLAILPDEVGACSVNDGCGVFNTLSIEETVNEWLVYNSKWDQAQRDKLPESDFAGPNQSFPIKTQEDVDSAAKLIGHADNPELVKHNIIRIAHRKGLKIPDAWMPASTNNNTDKDKLSMNERQNIISWLTTNCKCYNNKKNTLDSLTDNELKEVLLENADKSVENDADMQFLSWLSNADKDIRAAFTNHIKNKMKGSVNAFPPKKGDATNPADPNAPEPDSAAAQAAEDEMAKKKQQQAAMMNTNTKVPTEEEYLKTLPESLREAVVNAKKISDSEKQRLVGQLTAHITDNTKRQQVTNSLMQKSLDDLRERVELMPVSNAQQTNGQQLNHIAPSFSSPVANYFGATGGPVYNANDDKELQSEKLESPTINWKELSKANANKD